jgi:AraC-like DNA-binding protein
VKVPHDDVFRRLCRARDQVHERCAEPLTVARLARAAGVSRYHFLRLFRDAFGETPHQYLMRLERARKLRRGWRIEQPAGRSMSAHRAQAAALTSALGTRRARPLSAPQRLKCAIANDEDQDFP